MSTARWTHPRTDGPRASDALHLAATTFYAYESELLDEWDLDAWLQLLDADFTYRVPVPVVADAVDAPGYDTRSLLMDETRDSIAENWQARLTDEHNAVSWADNPPVRHQRLVTAVRVRETDAPDAYLVRSKVQVLMVRQSADPKQLHAERYDILRRTDGDFRIASRFATLVETVLDAPRPRTLL